MDISKFKEIEEGMSNLDLSIDKEFEEKLRMGGVFGSHSAWNFNGLVWYENGLFYEEVWRHRICVGIHKEDSLEKLMKTVNDIYGWE